MPLCSHKLMYWPLYSRISKHGPARPESDVDQFDPQCYFHLPLQPSPDPALEPWRQQKPGNLAAKEHLIASLPTRLSNWVELPQKLPSRGSGRTGRWQAWRRWKSPSMAAESTIWFLHTDPLLSHSLAGKITYQRTTLFRIPPAAQIALKREKKEQTRSKQRCVHASKC
jgi:hypothetical protein